ncbi:DUF1269 domain-containing protein [Corallococcus exiguus]|uniref:DUF1269 domain-containing protein n=1 Tax=Corallococcus exiguus TaxID=83462 RepID=UPI001A8D6DA9|nr:DUF1269 domain-containing protein [Corallococcus exiguus]MBN8471109.1 DUF1269 domain-containing protein [Corallococcus exiguus]
MMNPSANAAALKLFTQVEQTGRIVLRGHSSLQAAREAIALAIRQSGHAITFDPGSSPELVDYLMVAVVDGADAAVQGAFWGMLVGMLFERPTLGAAIGAGLAGGFGVTQGLQRVEQGWRIRAVRTADQTPVLTIEAHRIG